MARRGTPRSRSKAHGYILFESLIALTVLSISIYVIQAGIRQAVIARGHAKDYTQARFLLEDLVNQLQLQPLLHEENRSGTFRAPNGRFAWTYKITMVDTPVPPPPPNVNPEQALTPENLPVPFLGKIEATVRWRRSGSAFSESVQTLFAPERMWLPPPPPPEPNSENSANRRPRATPPQGGAS